MLKLCADEHAPIIYETDIAPINHHDHHICPLCFYLDMIDEYKEKIKELKKELKEIETKIIKKTHNKNFDRIDDIKLNLE